MASSTINRHEKISHFYGDKRNSAGDLLNDKNKTLLEELEFESYRDLTNWLAREFLAKDLDWRTLGAGSVYPTAIPNVIQFLEEKLKKDFLITLSHYWPTFNNKQKKTLYKNARRFFSKPELHHKHENDFLFQFRVFRRLTV